MAGPSTHEVPLGADEPKMVIEAFRLGLGTIRRRDYPVWFANALRDGRVYQKRNPDYPVECTIRTLEGEMDANLGDYVIRALPLQAGHIRDDRLGSAARGAFAHDHA